MKNIVIPTIELQRIKINKGFKKAWIGYGEEVQIFEKDE